ncbi:MAG: zf-TFIIB domain-containing protein [Rubrivivax sp.]|nr:zf-TFIIB domain-containing protein [Rubrivivax sp.]
MPAPTDDPRTCPHCRATMAPLQLRAHTGRQVQVDHCATCRLVWFDTLESVQLAGLGWVELLREMSRDETRPSSSSSVPPRPANPGCPVCGEPLKTVRNLTRWGRFPMQECPAGHGHLHTDAGLLAERGLVRTLLPPEREALRTQRRALHCLSCGARAEGDADACAWCATPLLVVDLPRLGHALRQRGAGGGATPPADGVALRWPCHACGTTLDPTRAPACPQCGAGLLAPAISDLLPLLATAEHELRAAANHPPRPKRTAPAPRSWRDTQLARLWRFFRPD